MAERAKLFTLKIAQDLDAISEQIERSEHGLKFSQGCIIKVKGTYWGKKYSENLPKHITSDFMDMSL